MHFTHFAQLTQLTGAVGLRRLTQYFTLARLGGHMALTYVRSRYFRQAQTAITKQEGHEGVSTFTKYLVHTLVLD